MNRDEVDQRESDSAKPLDPASPVWQVLFAVGIVMVTVLAYLSTSVPLGWQLVVPLMGALTVWYLALGLWILRDQDRYYASPTSWVFAAGVVACFLPVVTIAPQASFGLFIISPLLFMTSGIGAGTVACAALLILRDPLRFAIGDIDLAHLPVNLAVSVMILLFAYWFGSWTQKIIMESESRAELIAKLKRSQADVQRLSQEAGALAERERIAREIHDTLAQGFTSIITLAQAVESELDDDRDAARRHVGLMRETAQENLEEARALVAALTPAPLAGNTLDGALRRLTTRLGDELGVASEMNIVGEPTGLGQSVQVGLLRGAQEALSNARQHARASSVTVTLEYRDDAVHLTVTDDGVGFDPTVSSNGHGRNNIQHRVRHIGGTCVVHSIPGQGTSVSLNVPYHHTEEAHA